MYYTIYKILYDIYTITLVCIQTGLKYLYEDLGCAGKKKGRKEGSKKERKKTCSHWTSERATVEARPSG
jgi:hypothetical protein